MKTQIRNRWKVTAAGLIFLVALLSAGYEAHASGPRVVDITAKRCGFSPDQITLKKGETACRPPKEFSMTTKSGKL